MREHDPLRAVIEAVTGLHAPSEALYGAMTEIGFHAAKRGEWRSRLLGVVPDLVFAVRALTTRQSIERGTGHLLFITQHAGAGWATLEPLVRHAESQGIRTTTVATSAVLRRHSERIRSVSSSVINLDRAVLSGVVLPQGSVRAHAAAAWRRLSQGLSDDSMENVGRRLGPYVRHLVRRFCAYEQAIRRLLETLDTPVVVNHADFTVAGGAAIAAARRLRVREVVLQHGFPATEYFPVRSAEYLIWGEAFRPIFLAGGAAADQIHTVGAPRLDELARLRPEARRSLRMEARSKWRLSHERNVTLVLSHRQSPAPPGFHERVDRILLGAAAKDAGTTWLVRPHPQERRRDWQRRTAGGPITMAPDQPLIEALCGADVVVSAFSSSLLEAMLLDRPAVQVIPRQYRGIPLYVGSKAVASTVEELLRLTGSKAAAESPWHVSQRNALEQWVVNRGHGTEAVFNHLMYASDGAWISR